MLCGASVTSTCDCFWFVFQLCKHTLAAAPAGGVPFVTAVASAAAAARSFLDLVVPDVLDRVSSLPPLGDAHDPLAIHRTLHRVRRVRGQRDVLAVVACCVFRGLRADRRMDVRSSTHRVRATCCVQMLAVETPSALSSPPHAAAGSAADEVGVVFFGAIRDGDEFKADTEYAALSSLRTRDRPLGGKYQVRVLHAESTLRLRRKELIARLADSKVCRCHRCASCSCHALWTGPPTATHCSFIAVPCYWPGQAQAVHFAAHGSLGTLQLLGEAVAACVLNSWRCVRMRGHDEVVVFHVR